MINPLEEGFLGKKALMAVSPDDPRRTDVDLASWLRKKISKARKDSKDKKTPIVVRERHDATVSAYEAVLLKMGEKL